MCCWCWWRYRLLAPGSRELVLSRYTEPEPELRLLIDKLRLALPTQPAPKITAAAARQPQPV